MRRLLGALIVVGLACAVAAAGEAPMKVLIITGQHNHAWKETTPFLKKMYEDSGRFAADVTEDFAKFDLTTLPKYDVIVDNYCGKRWGEAAEKALTDFVSGGKGLVIYHAATISFSDWPEFEKLAGYTWRGSAGTGHGPAHAFNVIIVDKEHPITKGMKDFQNNTDELYHKLLKQPTMKVLATAFSADKYKGTGKDEPLVAWQEYGKGRVFDNILGHDVNTIKNVAFQAIMLRGTEWAATGKVTIPIPDDWPDVKPEAK
jgi:type 1 glutamine amidotransferase